MLYHIAHAAEDHRFIVTSGFEELGQLGFAPGPQTVAVFAAQAGGNPAVNRRIAARQVIIAFAFAERFFLHRQATRGMTGAAVAQAFHQIAAALQHRVNLRVGDKVARRRGEDAAPERQRPAHRQRPWDVGVLVGDIHRLHAVHKVGVHGAHVRFADPRERGIRHRRIERGTVFPHALAHRVVELFEGVPADAVFFIRRDIGGVDGADRRLHRQTAGERFPCFAVGVAGDTVPRPRQILPLLNQIAVRRRLFGEGRAAQCPKHQGR